MESVRNGTRDLVKSRLSWKRLAKLFRSPTLRTVHESTDIQATLRRLARLLCKNRKQHPDSHEPESLKVASIDTTGPGCLPLRSAPGPLTLVLIDTHAQLADLHTALVIEQRL